MDGRILLRAVNAHRVAEVTVRTEGGAPHGASGPSQSELCYARVRVEKKLVSSSQCEGVRIWALDIDGLLTADGYRPRV